MYVFFFSSADRSSLAASYQPCAPNDNFIPYGSCRWGADTLKKLKSTPNRPAEVHRASRVMRLLLKRQGERQRTCVWRCKNVNPSAAEKRATAFSSSMPASRMRTQWRSPVYMARASGFKLQADPSPSRNGNESCRCAPGARSRTCPYLVHNFGHRLVGWRGGCPL